MKPLFLIILALAIIGGGYLFVQESDFFAETMMEEKMEDEATDQMNEETMDNDTDEMNSEDNMNEASTENDSEESMVELDTSVNVETAPVTTKEFTIDSFSYGYSMEEIRVNEGDTVTINLTNSNGLHDWVVDEFNAATETIRAGEETSVTFVADKAGTYEFYCSIGNHRAQGMVGKLIVE